MDSRSSSTPAPRPTRPSTAPTSLSVAVIPEGFSEGLMTGKPVSITFKQLGSGGQEGQIAASIVQSAALELAGEAQVYAQGPRRAQ